MLSTQNVICDDLIFLLKRSTIINSTVSKRFITGTNNNNNKSLLFSTNSRTASMTASFKNNKSSFEPSLLSTWNFDYMKTKKKDVEGEKTMKDTSTDNSMKKWSNYTLPSKKTIEEQKLSYERRIKEAQNKVDLAKSTKNDDAIQNMSTSATGSTKKKRSRTLRPRKALITLSPKAISHLKALLDQPEPKLIRIGTRNRGCSGLTYDLQYITKPEKFDEIVEQDGVKVIIDSKALFSVVGSEMDWIDDTLSSRFVFRNPNSKGTCGCGESFMV